MKYIYPAKTKGALYIAFSILMLTSGSGFAQLIYQPYSYQFYQKLNKTVYSPATALHTALKPYFISDASAMRQPYDSLMQNNIDNSNKSWLNHVLFSGHVVSVKNKDYTFYMDYFTDFGAGYEFNDSRSTNINTRGYQIGGTIGSKFFFYTSGFENQGKFANYEEAYITKTGMVPSQSYDRTSNNNSQVKGSRDWSYSTAMLGYAPSEHVSIALGQDKIFIGDGYRSVLLSDYSSTYPLLRFSIDIGKHIQYTAIWAYMDNQLAPTFDVNPSGPNYRRTWAAFHYIDWNITNRASLGFFNAVITAETDDQGNRHGFDINYVNPVYFMRSLGPGSIPDHTLAGFNGKYKVLDKTIIYGQVMFDQSQSTNTGPRNAFQLGLRGADLFKVSNLNYLFEGNTATPYTYSNQYPIVNYAQFNEPLAHPFGANFKELLGILNYSIGKFDLQGELDYAKYGLNTATVNYGKDITLADNTLPPSNNTGTGQGISTTLKYAEGTVAYVLNPKYNLRVEIGAVLRQETNALTTTNTALITFGLRTTFRNLYHDF